MRAPPPVPLLLLLVLLALPSVARAQQPTPPIPPVGEPPPPETRLQERAAIEAQERQAYEQANQDQLYRQAVSEVEAERRRAWDQRGRDAVPPPARGKLPVIEPNILARIGSAGDNVLVMGPSAALKLRMRRYWGLEAAGGILWARDYSSPPPPSSRFIAAFSEVSALGWLSKASGKYAEADHAFLRAGFQLAFPISTANVPPVYLAPFASIGGVFALGPLYRGKGYAAILFETRFGHRFGLGSFATSPMEGFMVDILTGPAVGF